MGKLINYFGSEKRFYTILIVLFLMWLGIMTLFYLKADEVTKSPCQICANKLNDDVVCTIQSGGEIRQRVFYPNFTILDR